VTKLLKGIQDDANFIKTHTLQPKWYKILKVFILLGFLTGYWILFGFRKTILFFAVFILLSLLVHLLYRFKTHKWTRSWLDFVVVEEEGGSKPKRIGIFYYLFVTVNAIIALVISQLF